MPPHAGTSPRPDPAVPATPDPKTMPLPWRLPEQPTATVAAAATRTGRHGAVSPRTPPVRARSRSGPAHRRSRSGGTRVRRVRHWIAAAGAGIVLLAIGLTAGEDGSQDVTTTGEATTPTPVTPPAPTTGAAVSTAPDPAEPGNGLGGRLGGQLGGGQPAGMQPRPATPRSTTGSAEATQATSPDSPVPTSPAPHSATPEPAAHVPSPAGSTCTPGPLRINLNGACL